MNKSFLHFLNNIKKYGEKKGYKNIIKYIYIIEV